MMASMREEDRPDIFGDKRARQAIALCLDRQKVVDTVLFGLSQVPDTISHQTTHCITPMSRPMNSILPRGIEMLEEVGWLDQDNNPSTPRQAVGVTNVPPDTPLILNYHHNLCNPAAPGGRDLYPISGRMRHWSERLSIPTPPIFMHRVLQVRSLGVSSTWPSMPSASTAWSRSAVGSSAPRSQRQRITGSAPTSAATKTCVFDAACQKALQTVSTDPEYAFHQEAQAIFAADLPSIPLYLRLKVAATRPDFCGFTLDPSSSSALADIETFDYGAALRAID